MTPDSESRMEQTLQWVADRMRVLKAGLRNHDGETIGIVLGDFAEKFGEDFAEGVFVRTVNRMIDEENFSFVED